MRVCVQSAKMINHLQTAVSTMRVAPPESGRLRERAIVATHVVSRALYRSPDLASRRSESKAFGIIQACSFDR